MKKNILRVFLFLIISIISFSASFSISDLDVEARLCMFRGENHELSRSGKPKHRIRRLTEITNWFEKYLK